MSKVIITAEIGCNHKGDLNIAKQMIKASKEFCNVQIAKFQKRSIKESLTQEELSSPHPYPNNSYGKTYGEHRQFLEFSIDQHRELKACCEEHGITYASSVWDVTSAKEIVSLNPKVIKVPSACNTNFELLSCLCDSFSGEIHLSLGMTSQTEEQRIVSFLEGKRRNKDVILYACTSGYPVADEDTSLLEIMRLKQKYSNAVKAIGFSGHHLGIAIDIAAVTLGAQYIERHFTLDRTWKGTDHAASLEPDGLRRLSRDIDSISKALTYKKQEILEVEKLQRKKLKWNRDAN
jgi:sialic acid synthase